jgi:hypothetical protein
MYKHHSIILALHDKSCRRAGGEKKNKAIKESERSATLLAQTRWKEQMERQAPLSRIGEMAQAIMDELIKLRLQAPTLEKLKEWIRPVAIELGIAKIVCRPGAPSQ